MSWKDNIDNLVRIGQLKRADHVEEDVAQYFGDASGYLADARLVTTPQARFLLAYEGIHALSMGVRSTARRSASTAAKAIVRRPCRRR